MRAGVWNARVLLGELREQNYTGGYTILKDWLHPQRSAARSVAVRRFETPPGKQAQVDWGHLGTLDWEGQERELWAFTFTMGYSQRLMAEVALDQKIGTLLRIHEEAFRQMGGVPEEILYDRMKTVWLGTGERGEIVWHPVFLDFARYWGFTPRLCRPLSSADQGEGRIRSEVPAPELSLRTARTRTEEPHGSECPTARVDCGSGQPAFAWNHARTSRRALGVEQFRLRPIVGRPSYPYVDGELRKVARDAYIGHKAIGIDGDSPEAERLRGSKTRGRRFEWPNSSPLSSRYLSSSRDRDYRNEVGQIGPKMCPILRTQSEFNACSEKLAAWEEHTEIF